MAILFRGGTNPIDPDSSPPLPSPSDRTSPPSPPLTRHVLVARAAQHGVHGVSHLVEEVLHHAGGQQGGGALGGRRQAEHQHHHRQLVLAALLALAAAADGEVAVLSVK